MQDGVNNSGPIPEEPVSGLTILDMTVRFMNDQDDVSNDEVDVEGAFVVGQDSPSIDLSSEDVTMM